MATLRCIDLGEADLDGALCREDGDRVAVALKLSEDQPNLRHPPRVFPEVDEGM